MKYWTREDIDDGASLPPELDDLVIAVRNELGTDGQGYPQIARVGAREEDEEDKEFFFELDLELSPGLTLPTYCGYVEFVLEDDSDNDVETHLRNVMEGLPICQSQLHRLQDIVHDARMRARREVAALNVAGIAIRLIDVTLSPYDHWRGETEPALTIRLEALDSGLIPREWDIQIDKIEDLEGEVASWRDLFAERSRARSELLALGADGRISQLALNAISHHGDPAETLHRFRVETRFWLQDKTAIYINNGLVVAGTGNPASKYHWNDDGLTVSSEFIAGEILANATGRPVTDLIDHPFLSPDMTVLSATSSFVANSPMVTIRLDMPYRLFCSRSGRVWDESERVALQEPDYSDRVVAFRKRER